MAEFEVISRFAGTFGDEGLFHEVIVQCALRNHDDTVAIQILASVGKEQKTSTITVDNHGAVNIETGFTLGGHEACLAMCAISAVIAIVKQCWKSKTSLADFIKCLKHNGIKSALSIAECVTKCMLGGGSGGAGDSIGIAIGPRT